jgi:hypothetical protein
VEEAEDARPDEDEAADEDADDADEPRLELAELAAPRSPPQLSLPPELRSEAVGGGVRVRRRVAGSLVREAEDCVVAGVAGFRVAAAFVETVACAGFFPVSEPDTDSSDLVSVVEVNREDGESEFTKRCSCAS